MVEEAYATGELKAISLTSGVAVSPKKVVQRTAHIIKQLTREYDLPIGVSVVSKNRFVRRTLFCRRMRGKIQC